MLSTSCHFIIENYAVDQLAHVEAIEKGAIEFGDDDTE